MFIVALFKIREKLECPTMDKCKCSVHTMGNYPL
jgi:hypothetical protein